MPLDVPTKKDVHKEGDKPQEHAGDTQQSRLLLSLEASKKPEAKPEQKAKPAASDDMAAYISSGIDKASSLLTDALNMLPSLTIDDKKPASTEKVDINSFLKEGEQNDGKGNAQAINAVDSGIKGFKLNTSKPLIENTKTAAQLKEWSQLFAAYDAQKPGKAGQVERTANALVHRDHMGKTDVIKTADGVQLSTADCGKLTALNSGEKFKLGADGKLQAGYDKDGNFTAVLDSGNHMVIEKDSERAYLVDANGKRYGQVLNRKNNDFEVYGEYQNNQLIVTNQNILTKSGLDKIIDQGVAAAVEKNGTVLIPAVGGIVAVGADRSFVALQDDGSALVSMSDGGHLYRSSNGQLTICAPDGTKKQVSEEFLESIKKSKRPEMIALIQAAAKLREFSRTRTIESLDGQTSLSIEGNVLKGTVNGSFTTEQRNGVTTTTNLKTGETQTVDINKKTVENKSADGTVDRIEAKPDGQFRIQTKDYTYDSGTVTTKEGDVFSANHVRLANGTELDENNTVTMADGTTIRADGSYTLQGRAKAEMVMAAEAAENKADSMAGYAEGLAGAIRSRAASGNATASDIASLESVFSSLCDAVAALGMVGDPSVSFKLYSAKGTVSESISTSLVNLNKSKAA